jgi:hypothetical protein
MMTEKINIINTKEKSVQLPEKEVAVAGIET